MDARKNSRLSESFLTTKIPTIFEVSSRISAGTVNLFVVDLNCAGTQYLMNFSAVLSHFSFSFDSQNLMKIERKQKEFFDISSLKKTPAGTCSYLINLVTGFLVAQIRIRGTETYACTKTYMRRQNSLLANLQTPTRNFH